MPPTIFSVKPDDYDRRLCGIEDRDNDISWEVSEKTNIGTDMEFFNGRSP